jgi:hypothetical protein
MNTEALEQLRQANQTGDVQKSVTTARDAITQQIEAAQMPQSTKKLAAKLFQENHHPGQSFWLPMSALRRLCHAVTNLDVVKHLRRMRRVGLIEYSIDYQTQRVELKFITTQGE